MLRIVSRIVLSLVCLGGAIVFAQSGQITGMTKDSTDAVVVGAELGVTNTETGIRYSAKTNEAGYYAVPLLPPGMYRMTVQASGFKPVSRGNIALETGKTLRIDFILEVGGVSESITVSDAAPLLQSESTTYGQFIESKTVADMPLNGRRVENLVTLAGGAMMATSGSRVVLAGGRGGFVNWIVDGANSAPALTEALEFYQSPPVAEVKEFRVMLNSYSAEYGQSESGVISLTTKSGTNQFHGSLYEFIRNDKLDARTFFASTKAPLRQNLFGFTVGGPIRKNRTFFYVSDEWQRVRRGSTSVLTVPTAAMRTGDFSGFTDSAGRLIPIYDPSTTRPDPARAGNFIRDPYPGNVIPANQIDPVGAKLAALLPLPNRPAINLAGGSNFGANPVTYANPSYLTIKGDHMFREPDRMWVKYNRVISPDGQRPIYPEAAADPSAYTRESRYWQLVGNWAHQFTPNVLNEVAANYRSTWYQRGQLDRNAGWPERLGLQGVSNLAFPTVGVTGYAGLGYNIHEQLNPSQWDTQITDNVNWFRGAHAVKFGGEARRSKYSTYYRPLVSGSMSFSPQATGLPGVNNSGNGLASLLVGLPASGSVLDQDLLDRRASYFAAYLQDDWKASSHLTINLGLRWETLTPRIDANDRVSGFDAGLMNPVSGTPGGMIFANRDGQSRALYNGDYNNFGPRVGIAWRPLGSIRTVVRAGYGLFYGTPHTATTSNAAGFAIDNTFTTPDSGITAPFTLRTGFPTTSRQELTPGFGAVRPGQAPIFSPTYMDPDRRVSYTHQWNFMVQREIGWETAIEAGYIASVGHKLWHNANININQVIPSLMGPGNTQVLRPFPQYGNVSVVYPGWGNSTYHSFNLKVEKRFSSGLNFLANYTFAKFIDDVRAAEGGSLPQGPQNIYDRKAEKSLSGNDVRNRFVLSSVYEMPVGRKRRWLNHGLAGAVLGGWNMGGILTMQQGFPVGLATQANTANAFSGAQRVNVLRDPSLPSEERSVARWFDTTAVAAPAPYTFGNASRALLTGPGLLNLDASLLKNHRWGEHYNLQFRWEAFNVLNHTQFSSPGTSLGSPTFGVITGTRAARVNQLGLNFEF